MAQPVPRVLQVVDWRTDAGGDVLSHNVAKSLKAIFH